MKAEEGIICPETKILGGFEAPNKSSEEQQMLLTTESSLQTLNHFHFEISNLEKKFRV